MCKTICVHESIFNNESNDIKRINNYLIFLDKTNGQTRTNKLTVSNILKRRDNIIGGVHDLSCVSTWHS